MAIKIYGMLDEDYAELGGEVKDSLEKDAYEVLSSSLSSPRIFGTRSQRGESQQSTATANLRGYIHLCVPVFNKFLTRSDGAILKKILGTPRDKIEAVINGEMVYSKTLGKLIPNDPMIPKKELLSTKDYLAKMRSDYDLTSVLNYTMVYSKSKDKLIKVSDADDVDDILCGPEYVKKLIDEFDIEKAVMSEFRDLLSLEFKAKGKVSHNKTGIKLIGNWYFETNTPLDPAKVLEFFADTVFVKDMSRLSVLLNMKSKRALYSLVPTCVAVLPKDMRPRVMDRHDPITAVYAEIIRSNQEMQLIKNTKHKVPEYVLKWSKLNERVESLQYKSDKNHVNRKSIEEILKTKHGHIRQNMLGKRQDSSGRATVVVNPTLPMDVIRIPIIMLPKLYRYHLIKDFGNDTAGFNSLINGSPEMILKRLTRDKDGKGSILDNVPALMGRQPTLHHLGVLAFRAEPTAKHAIEVPPLVMPGYNMDCDGDTSWLKVPMSAEAISEAWNLMLASQNLFMHKDGECTVVPKQDMVYGLYKCTQKEYKLGASVKTYSNDLDIRKDVMEHKVKVYDTVTVAGKDKIAGYAAFESCFPKSMKIDVKEVTKKSLKKYINKLVEQPTKHVTNTLNNMVLLGFRVARMYSPPMSIFLDIDRSKYVEQFEKDISKPLSYFDLGFTDERTYSLSFDEAYEKMVSEMMKEVKSKLDFNNGFLSMARCGARGDDSNLQQIFACKGKVIKAEGESFNCVIEKSYTQQLTSLEHFLTAYGGRKGLIDKTLTTGDPGYMQRKLTHTSQSLVVKSADCGTTEGIPIRKKDIINANFSVDWHKLDEEIIKIVQLSNEISYSDIKDILEENKNVISNTITIGKTLISKQLFLESLFGVDFVVVNEQFEKMITGRYMFSNGASIYVTKSQAHSYAFESSLDQIIIRSPLTCKDPCCSKCYGEDLGNHKSVAIGTAVGVIASQSLSEPGTQMTMNQFHKGGVVSGGDMMSNFSRLEKYLEVGDFSKTTSYEPIAWATGDVIERVNPKGVYVKISGNTKKGIQLPAGSKLKKRVTKGEGLCVFKGDNSVDELVEYCGIAEAQLRLLYALYSIYKAEGAISSKHFEVMISMMTLYSVIDTNRKDLQIGQMYHASELFNNENVSKDFKMDDNVINGTIYRRRLISVKTVSSITHSALTKFMLEDMGRGLLKDVIMEITDEVEDPIQRVLLGMRPKVGTYYPDYIDERKRL